MNRVLGVELPLKDLQHVKSCFGFAEEGVFKENIQVSILIFVLVDLLFSHACSMALGKVMLVFRLGDPPL